MKHVLFTLCLFSLFLSTAAFANQLPAQMEGMGIFTFKGSVLPAASKEAARKYANEIKVKGFAYVMIKSHDGGSWGTVVNGKWVPCFSEDLVDAFHAEGMRVYSYYTARLTNDTSITESVRLAARTLDMGADGMIIDDLGLFGVSTEKWEMVFRLLRKEVDARSDKILMSSTFPHLMNLNKKLWGIAFQYSDYFLPQAYWMQFEAFENGKRVIMQPQNALSYAQDQFDSIRARYPKSRCRLIPIGRTYGEQTDAASVKKFTETAARFYKGAGLFVLEMEPKKGGWAAIKDAVAAFNPGHGYKTNSCFDITNGPCRDVPDEPILVKPSTEEKKGRTKKTEPDDTYHAPSGSDRSWPVKL
ncbi:MAG: hypothetical protein NTX72_02240 [Candidatus Uhrbacteria bacterium]|nr:hypothetical protein [Candidatus Uhrbacteria bacterium]